MLVTCAMAQRLTVPREIIRLTGVSDQFLFPRAGLDEVKLPPWQCLPVFWCDDDGSLIVRIK